MKNLAFFFFSLFAFLLGALCVVVFWIPAQNFISPTKQSSNLSAGTVPLNDYLESSLPKEELQQVIIPQKSEVGEIVHLLQSEFIDQNPLIQKLSAQSSPEEVDTVLQKLTPIVFLEDAHTKWTNKPLFAWIDDQVGYVRLTNFNPETINQVVEKWNEWQPQAKGLILDLRYTKLSPNYDQLPRLTSFFIEANTPLFSLQSTKSAQKIFYSIENPVKIDSKIPLIVLVGANTQGEAEVLAHILQTQAKAIIVGQKTAGRSALYTETQLTSGHSLYLATNQVMSANGQKLLGQSIQPDILTSVPSSQDYASWQLAYDQNLALVLAQPPLRQKQSEKTLQDQKNPEWENKSKREKEFNLQSQDIVLQRAVQTLRSILLQS
jgi:hypothetical protein